VQQQDDEVQGREEGEEEEAGWRLGPRSMCEAIRHFQTDPYYPRTARLLDPREHDNLS
jgi:hypothetical protein